MQLKMSSLARLASTNRTKEISLRIWNKMSIGSKKISAKGMFLSLLVAMSFVLSYIFWDTFGNDSESTSTTLRNLSFMFGGAIALYLAYWRSKSASDQVDTATRQADTAHHSLLNDRYQRAAEMLGHAHLPVRLGGIHALINLAEDYPVEYGMQVTKLLCAFVRNPTSVELGQDLKIHVDEKLLAEGKINETYEPRVDIQEIVSGLGRIRYCDAMLALFPHNIATTFKLEHDWKPLFDLHGADLRGVNFSSLQMPFLDLRGANLAKSDFSEAIIPHSVLRKAKLFCTTFRQADLSKSNLIGLHLPHVYFDYADLSHARLGGTTIEYGSFLQVNLSNADFVGATITGIGITNSNMQMIGTGFKGAALDNVTFSDGFIELSDFDNAELHNVTFEFLTLDVRTFLHARQLEKINLRTVSYHKNNHPGVIKAVEERIVAGGGTIEGIRW